MYQMTMEQRGTVKELIGMRIALHVLGITKATLNPVLWIKDQRRKFPMEICKDGVGRKPLGEVRSFTEDELLALDERDADLLLSLPIAKLTPELLEEVWFDGREVGE